MHDTMHSATLRKLLWSNLAAFGIAHLAERALAEDGDDLELVGEVVVHVGLVVATLIVKAVVLPLCTPAKLLSQGCGE